MNKLRVLLAVEPRLLSDSIKVLLIKDNNDVLETRSPKKVSGILLDTRRFRIDAIVATMDPNDQNQSLVAHLQVECPEIPLFAIDVQNECARLYRNGQLLRTVSNVAADELSGLLLWTVNETEGA